MLTEAVVVAVGMIVLGGLSISATLAAFVQRDYTNVVIGIFASLLFFAVAGISAAVASSLFLS
jgi:hypothetical protein